MVEIDQGSFARFAIMRKRLASTSRKSLDLAHQEQEESLKRTLIASARVYILDKVLY